MAGGRNWSLSNFFKKMNKEIGHTGNKTGLQPASRAVEFLVFLSKRC